MSKETVITCPKPGCDGACFATSLIRKQQDIPDAELYPELDRHYMVLTCQRCHTQLQFVVDLQPSFARAESACAVIG
jgi:hypothetical protein